MTEHDSPENLSLAGELKKDDKQGWALFKSIWMNIRDGQLTDRNRDLLQNIFAIYMNSRD